jgi:hypothetical protein
MSTPTTDKEPRMERQVTIYEVHDKAWTLVSSGEVYVYPDRYGGWSYTIPESIRDLPAGDYVFSIGELEIETAIIDPNTIARARTRMCHARREDTMPHLRYPTAPKNLEWHTVFLSVLFYGIPLGIVIAWLITRSL